MSKGELKGSFDSGAAAYDRLRPGYPDAVVRFCVPGRRRVVADIGAGTGKLTRGLVAAGHDVIAVEPSAGMREQLARSMPGLPVVDGAGERTGLSDGAVDAVTLGQCWHWVDTMAGSRELARIVRPGGSLAVAWNHLDTTVEWMCDLEDAMHGTVRAWRPEAFGQVVEDAPCRPFGHGEQLVHQWADRVSIADLRALVTTRSYYLEGDSKERRELEEATATVVRRLFPGRRPEDVVELPYRTTAWRYHRW